MGVEQQKAPEQAEQPSQKLESNLGEMSDKAKNLRGKLEERQAKKVKTSELIKSELKESADESAQKDAEKVAKALGLDKAEGSEKTSELLKSELKESADESAKQYADRLSKELGFDANFDAEDPHSEDSPDPNAGGKIKVDPDTPITNTEKHPDASKF